MDEQSDSVRLNKFLALRLGSSRREADEIIVAGRVKVNGEPAVVGQRVGDGDVIAIDGKTVSPSEKPDLTYLAMNKPVGYVCSRKQQGDAPTIYSLLPPEYFHLKPVGRLDKDSSGLILLTNDGDFAHRMTHPKFAKLKKYEVSLLTPLVAADKKKIEAGVALEDGTSKLELNQLEEGNDKAWLVTMHEGKNRQIRRTFAALGYKVSKLRRTTFGDYELGDLAAGSYSSLSVL